MISQKYKNAYKEVLEIIKYLPENELSRIPKSKIEYLQRNQNPNHIFNFDSSVALEEQNISREANAIILNLINNYFLNEEKRRKLAAILENNENKYQEKQREIYNPDNLFKNKPNINKTAKIQENLSLVKYEEDKWYKKIFNIIKRIVKR